MDSNAQNAIGVTNIQSPQDQLNYNSNTTIDIRVFVQNKGPHNLSATDSLYFNYNVSTKDTMLFFQKTIVLGVPLDSAKGSDFTLHKDYNFPIDDYYSICAEVSGTKVYPTNTAKQRSACSYIPVGLLKSELKLNHLYYANGQIIYELPESTSLTLKLFNLSGKLLLEKNTYNQAGQINCDGLPTALYLLKLNDHKGNQKTAKIFIR